MSLAGNFDVQAPPFAAVFGGMFDVAPAAVFTLAFGGAFTVADVPTAGPSLTGSFDVAGYRGGRSIRFSRRRRS